MSGTFDVDRRGVTELSLTSAGVVGHNTYDALNPKGRRKAPSGVTMSEDRHLTGAARRKLIGGHRELRRNSSLLGWMCRRHLDYVASHTFQSVTGDDGWDDEVEEWMREESDPEHSDVRGMFDLPQFVRTAEAMAVIDGDIGVLQVDRETGLLQGIEGDRIKDPYGPLFGMRGSQDGHNWYNGVRVNKQGRPTGYAIYRRVDGYSAMEYERIVPAAYMHLHGYVDRFDQYRGVSPVSSAYNEIRDVYEGISLSLVQTKIAGLFGLKITRDAEAAMGQLSGGVDDDGEEDKSKYAVDFGSGPIVLDMDPGDDAAFMGSDNPGANMQSFWQFVTMIAIKSLDLPYALFDEAHSNFFGNKTAWLAYDRACEHKRARVKQMLNRITLFKYRIAVRDGRLKPPRKQGEVVSLARKPWLWVPRKMPWWRPLEEVTASLKAIEGGLTTPQKVCAENDQGDWYENVDEIAKAIEYAKKKGVTLTFALADDMASQVLAARGKDA